MDKEAETERRWAGSPHPPFLPNPILFPTGARAYSAGVAEGGGNTWQAVLPDALAGSEAFSQAPQMNGH